MWRSESRYANQKVLKEREPRWPEFLPDAGAVVIPSIRPKVNRRSNPRVTGTSNVSAQARYLTVGLASEVADIKQALRSPMYYA